VDVARRFVAADLVPPIVVDRARCLIGARFVAAIVVDRARGIVAARYVAAVVVILRARRLAAAPVAAAPPALALGSAGAGRTLGPVRAVVRPLSPTLRTLPPGARQSFGHGSRNRQRRRHIGGPG